MAQETSTRGVRYTKHFDETLKRNIYETQIPNLQFLYEVSTTRNPEFWPGDMVTLPDGREFRYVKSTGASALYGSRGVEITYTGFVAWTAFAVAGVVGDEEVTVPAATHAAVTKDQLRGGYIIIFDGASDLYTTVRGIVGNDASDADVAFKVYLDAPLTYAITAGTSVAEVYKNPWEAVTLASNEDKAKVGVPVAYVSAAENYFWVQTKGIIWCPPQTSDVGARAGMAVTWRHDGTFDAAGTAYGGTVPAGSCTQPAGHVLVGSQSGNGPLVMLTGE